jgi:putative membrane protein
VLYGPRSTRHPSTRHRERAAAGDDNERRRKHAYSALGLRPALAAMAIAGISAGTAFADGAISGIDSTFLKASHQGNLAEIAAGQDAQKNATTRCVKKVGAVLVRDHTRLDKQGKALADKLNVALPGMPTAEQQKQLAAVRAKAGTAAYDKAWLAAQAAAHQKTLRLIDDEIRSGKNAEVKAAARAARPIVAMHLGMVRGGTCRAHAAPGAVHAGSGGQAADAAGLQSRTGAAALGGGALLIASGAVWAARTRRTADR